MYDQDILNKIEENTQYARATEQTVAGSQGRIEQLLEDNLDYARRIHTDTQRIRSYMRWRLVVSIIWLALFLAPFVVAVIYLPPLFSQFYELYGSLLTGDSDMINIMSELQKVQ